MKADTIASPARRTGATLGAIVGIVVFYLLWNHFAPRHLPFGVLIKGAVLGGLSSLVAMGLVLVYRSARIVNFAQAAIGGLAAAVATILVTGEHWSYFLAVPVGLAVAVATGWGTDRVVARRFANAPRLIFTVATIGVAQILGAAEIGLPSLVSGNLSAVTTFTTPFSFHFKVYPFVFTGDYLVAAIVVPVALAALFWFFQLTDTGVAIRAAADSSERALLLGIPVRRLSMVTWMVAAGLSGVGSILTAPITGSNLGQATSGPTELLIPLAAAVLARMESLPATLAWAIALNVLYEAVFWSYGNSTYVDVAVFFFILGALLLQRRRKGRVEGAELGDYVALREVSPIPAALARLRQVRTARWVVLGILFVLAAAAPVVLSATWLVTFADIAIYAVIAVSVVALTGWAGQISLGQYAFVGVGAAVAGALMVHLHAEFFLAMLAAAVVGAAVACLIGIPALRIPGLYLAVVTLSFAVMVSTWILSSEYFPWLDPSRVFRPVLFHRFNLANQWEFYELCLLVLVGSAYVARNFRRTRAGRAVVAVRDNPRAAAAYGISPFKAKLLAFAFSGALAGIAGALTVVSQQGIGFAGFDPNQSVAVFIMVVIGGLGSITGGVLGAAYVVGMSHLSSAWQLLAQGGGVLLLLMVFPEGLGGLVFVVRDWLLLRFAGHRAAAEAPGALFGEDEGGLPGERGGSGPRPVGVGAIGDGAIRDGAAGVGAIGDGAIGDGAIGDGAIGDGAIGDGAIGDGAIGDGLFPAARDGYGRSAGRAPEHAGARSKNPLAHTAALRLGALEDLETQVRHGASDGAAPYAGPTGGRPPIASISGLEVCYGSSQVLYEVSIGVAQGEVVALLGTNGAGKSTTLRAIAGLARVTSGRVDYVGQDITAWSPGDRVRAGLVTVLGGRGIFPSLTVEENLRIGGWIARRHLRDEAFAAAATDRVLQLFPRLAERRTQGAGLLSGGEQQMLALAQALLCRPKLLMIDELSLGLAPTVVSDLLDVVRALAQSGVTVVVVEQSVNVATAVSRRAVFMERGRVRFSGPTPDLTQQPKLLRSVFLQAAAKAERRRKSAAGLPVDLGERPSSSDVAALLAGGPAGAAPPPASPPSPLLPPAPPPPASAFAPPFAQPAVPAAPPGAIDPQPAAVVPAFAVIGASKHYGGVAALTDVSLSVAPGEILGIIGSNGAGKTTLFDVCSGFIYPDAGRVMLFGEDVTTVSPAERAARRLGRVFQDARLFPSMTLSEAIATALEQSVPVRDPLACALGLGAVVESEHIVSARVAELIAELGLERFRDRFVSELSTGTRRIAELACAVAHEPKVLLLDEPTAGIAQRESEALGELLLGLRDQTGAAFVVIEHDVPLVSSIADRLACMHLGSVIAEGDPSSVLNDAGVLASYLGADDLALAGSRPPPPAVTGSLVGMTRP